MTSTVPVTALAEWLAGEVAVPGPVAVLAGHFAIYSAGGTAHELLDEPDAAPAGAGPMIEFTRHTWTVACQVAANQPGRPFQLVPLVDDIQFVRPALADRGASERLAAALAADYLERVRELPRFHARELQARGLAHDRILRQSEDRWLFSERGLRIAAVYRLRRRRLARSTHRVALEESDGGSTMTVTLPGQSEYRLVQAGHTTCAGGYLELLAALHDRGIRKLVAMVPLRCLGQVSLGTSLARHILALSRFTAISVGIPDAGTTGVATVARGE